MQNNLWTNCINNALRSLIAFVLIAYAPAFASEQLGNTWRKAVQSNHLDIIRQYLHSIEDIDIAAQNGKTALMAAAFKGAHELVTHLLAKGADANRNNHLKGSPLMYAAGSGSVITVSVLLEYDAQVNHQSSNGWSALMMAVAKNHPLVVHQLCQAGADVNQADVYGWTPLMRAAFEGRQAIVEQLLVQPNIDIERINDHGQSALHLAARQNRSQIVSLLLARNAKQYTDFSGNTPLSIARALGHNIIVNQLQNFQR